ncbi:MAG: leucine-rich repeat protein [Candidatus Methanoplasma sp.]|nr:leucine-rich repeat protein [Candidatus Methanoplasma sp.]
MIIIILLLLATIAVSAYAIAEAEGGRCGCSGESPYAPPAAVTVSYDSQGGSYVPSQSVYAGSKVPQPSQPTRLGYSFSGWYKQPACIDAWDFDVDVVNASLTLYAKWDTIQDPYEQSYTVTFDTRGGSPLPQITGVDYNSRIVEPPAPSYGSLVFGGWYRDEACLRPWNFAADRVTGDVTLYAKWTPATHTVEFDSNGGTPVGAIAGIAHGAAIAAPAQPTKTGHAFAGWYRDSSLSSAWSFSDPVESSMTLFAKWDVLYYNVEFHSAGGSPVESQRVAYNGLASKPLDPTLDGCALVGWYSDPSYPDSAAWDFGASRVVSDTELYAKWEANRYEVSFDSCGGSAVPLQHVYHGDPVAEPAEPTRAGHAFRGWYADSSYSVAWNFGNPVTSDMTLFAMWVETRTITFDYQRATGGNALPSIEVVVGEAYALPSPSRSVGPIGSYSFGGWYDEVGGINSILPSREDPWAQSGDWGYDGDLTLHAYWEGTTYLNYYSDPGKVSLDGLSSSLPGGAVLIQEWYRGTMVTEINYSAFASYGAMTGIYIPDTIAAIGERAFASCTGLTAVDLPDSVTSIGDSSFIYCSGLGGIDIPDGVTSISDWAFHDCSNLASVDLPANLTSIGRRAFSGCVSLTGIDLPDSLESIGKEAFNGCTILNNVVMPEGVTVISDSVFNGCTSLTNITLSSATTYIGASAFRMTGLTSISLPDTVESIGNMAFGWCGSLTHVTIPDNVTVIGEGAFRNCASLESVTIGGGVETIGYRAFESSGIASITLPDSVTSVGASAFYNCASLASVVMSANLANIGDYAFQDCVSLAAIDIPGSVATIGMLAFSGCTHLSSVTLHSGLASIGASAFAGCTGLEAIALPDGLTSIGTSAFSGCAALKKIFIPISVTDMGASVFSGCALLHVYAERDGRGSWPASWNGSVTTARQHWNSTRAIYDAA